MFSRLLHIGIKNLLLRRWNTVAALFAFVGVIYIYVLLLSVSQGLAQLWKNSEHPIAILVKAGAQSEMLSTISKTDQRKLADILANQHGINVMSEEALLSIRLNESEKDNEEMSLPLRGISLEGVSLRNPTLTQGRWFEVGSDEIVIGQKLLGKHKELVVGKRLYTGKKSWLVVGVFESEYPLFESEIWGELSSVQSAFSRGSMVQSAYFPILSGMDLLEIQKSIDGETDTKLELFSAGDYFARQMSDLKSYLDAIIWGLSVIMFVGLVFGGVSIMEANFTNRKGQSSILCAIGVNKGVMASAMVAEGTLLGFVSGLIGVLFGWLSFSGQQISTLNQTSQIVISLELSIYSMGYAILAAVVLGAVCSLLPVWNVRHWKVN